VDVLHTHYAIAELSVFEFHELIEVHPK
jgi:prenyltransferase beta subunit